MKQRFKEFLDEHNVYYAYLVGLGTRDDVIGFDEMVETLEPQHLISAAFFWKKDAEMWDRIDKLWTKRVEEMKS